MRGGLSAFKLSIAALGVGASLFAGALPGRDHGLAAAAVVAFGASVVLAVVDAVIARTSRRRGT
jgi:hypothetical protein